MNNFFELSLILLAYFKGNTVKNKKILFTLSIILLFIQQNSFAYLYGAEITILNQSNHDIIFRAGKFKNFITYKDVPLNVVNKVIPSKSSYTYTTSNNDYSGLLYQDNLTWIGVGTNNCELEEDKTFINNCKSYYKWKDYQLTLLYIHTGGALWDMYNYFTPPEINSSDEKLKVNFFPFYNDAPVGKAGETGKLTITVTD